MKVFAIRDDELGKKDLGYLIYYEKSKSFYIELPDDADEWETPLILASFLKRGEYSLNAYWSKMWVHQRIVPTDRQNLGMILRDNGISEYDEFKLLMLGEGRCAQDNYYLEPLKNVDLPPLFQERNVYKVNDVVPLAETNLLVFFRNGQVKKCDISKIVGQERSFKPVLENVDIFNTVEVLSGGHGICWGSIVRLADKKLYDQGKNVNLCLDDFKNFVRWRVITSSEATDILDCSRQNLNKLVKHEQLHPLKALAKTTLFLKTEIMERAEDDDMKLDEAKILQAKKCLSKEKTYAHEDVWQELDV